MPAVKHQGAAWLAVVMLALGGCSCRGAVVVSTEAGEDVCCATRAPSTERADNCACAGHGLISAKTDAAQAVAVAPSSHLQVFESFDVADARVPQRFAREWWAMPHWSPPGQRQRLLQVWLI